MPGNMTHTMGTAATPAAYAVPQQPGGAVYPGVHPSQPYRFSANAQLPATSAAPAPQGMIYPPFPNTGANGAPSTKTS